MLRPWELNFTISRESHQSIHQQLTTKFIDAIQTGAFGAGMPLPGTREMAQRLGINRKTVIRVYDELTAHGWLYTEDKRGTFVSRQPPNMPAAEFLSAVQMDHLHALNDSHQAYFAHTPTHASDGWIDLSYPHGDHRIFNLEALVRATRHAIIAIKRLGHAKSVQSYGSQPLRQAIAQMLNFEQGLNIAPQHLCIAPTARMGLDIVAKTLFRPCDYLLLETCHSASTRAVFQYHNIHVQTVKHHANGIDLGDLEKLCINYPVRAVYVSSNCQQPTTVQMSAENRAQLLRLAKRYDFYIVEDNTAAQFSYERTLLPSLASLAQQQVIHIGSLAHLMSASDRAVYMAVPLPLLGAVEQGISHFGDGGNLINELTLTELLLSGEVKKQLKRAQKIYQERRDDCCRLLQQELGAYLYFDKPNAGFSVWVQMHEVVDLEKLTKQLHREQLKLDIASSYAQSQHRQPGFALYFAHLNQDEFKVVVKRLKQVFTLLQKKATYAAYG